jgi:hypothetical protein
MKKIKLNIIYHISYPVYREIGSSAPCAEKMGVPLAPSPFPFAAPRASVHPARRFRHIRICHIGGNGCARQAPRGLPLRNPNIRLGARPLRGALSAQPLPEKKEGVSPSPPSAVPRNAPRTRFRGFWRLSRPNPSYLPSALGAALWGLPRRVWGGREKKGREAPLPLPRGEPHPRMGPPIAVPENADAAKRLPKAPIAFWELFSAESNRVALRADHIMARPSAPVKKKKKGGLLHPPRRPRVLPSWLAGQTLCAPLAAALPFGVCVESIPAAGTAGAGRLGEPPPRLCPTGTSYHRRRALSREKKEPATAIAGSWRDGLSSHPLSWIS